MKNSKQNYTTSNYLKKITSKLLTKEKQVIPPNSIRSESNEISIQSKENKIKDFKKTLNYFDIKKVNEFKSPAFKDFTSTSIKKPKNNQHIRLNTDLYGSSIGNVKMSFLESNNNYNLSKKTTIVHGNETKQKVPNFNNSIMDKLKKYQLSHKRSISNLDNNSKKLNNKSIDRKTFSPNFNNQNNQNNQNNKSNNNEAKSSRLNANTEVSNTSQINLYINQKYSFINKKFDNKLKIPIVSINKSPEQKYLFTDGNANVDLISKGIKKEYDKFKESKHSYSGSNEINVKKKASISMVTKNISNNYSNNNNHNNQNMNLVTLTTKEKTSTNEVIGFSEEELLMIDNSLINEKSIIDQSGDYFLKESQKISEYIKQCKL